MQWFVLLTSGEATEADRHAFHTWLEKSAQHAAAWQRVQDATSEFRNHDAPAEVVNTLKRLYGKPKSASRRQTLKKLGMLLAVGSAAYLGYRQQPWTVMLADHATGTGERRELALEDGSRLFLNTGTAVNVRFSDSARIVELLKGEILIETGHEQRMPSRDFILQTQHGAVTALGTRFHVRDYRDFSRVSVFEGAVRIAPVEGSDITLQAGEAADFSRAKAFGKTVADPAVATWSRGFLVVDDMPMPEFVAELSRYRQGVLQCDPALAGLHVSGSFPINDTDQALDMLTHKFPVRIAAYTRYWVRVEQQ